MKIIPALTITSALLLAAGCAHEERHADYGTTEGQTSTSYNSQSTYYGGQTGTTQNDNDRNTSSGASVGAAGTYSANGGSDSDNTIVTQVRQSLEQDPEIAAIVPSIQITAQNGTIVLSGNCQSDEQKRQIEALVQKSTGVVTVNNQLTVNASGGTSNTENSNRTNPNTGNATTGNSQQLNPTGNTSGNSQRLYKDANSADNSTNNALNPTSNSGENKIYEQGNQPPSSLQSSNSSTSGELNPTSRSNSSNQIYQGSEEKSGKEQNTQNNSSSNQLNPTSRPNGASQMHQGSEEKSDQQQNSNSSTNSLNPTSRENGQSTIHQEGNQDQNSNSSTNGNSLNPTSRPGGQSQIYQQGNQGQTGQEQDTNKNNQAP